MVLFLFLSTILYFKTISDYDNTIQDIDNMLRDSILIGPSYKMTFDSSITSFMFNYFQVLS